jgi:hypothetical protein
MATKLIFQDLLRERELQCYATDYGTICIEILNYEDEVVSFINLDRPTAIKLVKTLKAEISDLIL